MGCVESSEAFSTEAAEDDETPPEEKPPAPAEKGKKKKNTRSRRDAGGKKDPLNEGENLRQRSENTKITVIWRRYSVFSSRRGSDRTEKSPEGEAAGPSRDPADVSQAESSSP